MRCRHPSHLWADLVAPLLEDMAWNAKARGSDSLNHDIILNRALCIINDNIISFGGLGVETFGLPKPSKLMISEFGSTEMSKELSYNQDEFCNFTQTHEPKLNGDQSIYYAILHTIHSSQGVFCLLMHVVALKKSSTQSNTGQDPFKL